MPRPDALPSPPSGPETQGQVASSESTSPMALTVKEVGEMLRLDPRTIRAMVAEGELDGNQRSHAIRVSRASVLDWLRGKRRVPRSKR